MKTIKLTQGKVAIVDDADFEWLNQWKWYAQKFKTGRTWYARRSCDQILMHRLITGIEDSKIEVDHQDRNGLLNVRSNLRKATRTQNLMNSGPLRGKRFKGTFLMRGHERKKPWAAHIRVSRKLVHLGCRATEEEAARLYDEAAFRLFGEFAYLNFPSEVSHV